MYRNSRILNEIATKFNNILWGKTRAYGIPIQEKPSLKISCYSPLKMTVTWHSNSMFLVNLFLQVPGVISNLLTIFQNIQNRLSALQSPWSSNHLKVWRNKTFKNFKTIFLYLLHFLCLCCPSEANLQLQCQPCWLPKKEPTCSCRLGDAGFEPGTAKWQSSALPMSHHTPKNYSWGQAISLYTKAPQRQKIHKTYFSAFK